MKAKNPIAPVTLISAIMLLLLSCHSKEQLIIEDIELPKNTFIRPDSIHKKLMMSGIVEEMSSLSKLEGEYVGFDGHKSLQPNYSSLLIKFADTGYLLGLTKHFNPIVRITAFESLVKLKYPNIRHVFLNLINDKDSYVFQSGCVGGPIPVNIACYSSIGTILTEKEKQAYRSNLRGQYKNTGFEHLLNYEY